ncbi:MAG: SUF system Fe-S cluster assembly regulator [Alphaproteobacteria bacterium]
MIKVSKMADYSVVMLSCFVSGTVDQIWSANDISNKTSLPLPTVSKILKLLVKGKVLVSHRGVQGGYSLSRFPDEITVADIITAIDGPIALTACVDDTDDCSVESICPMSGGWDTLNAKIKKSFEEVNLRDIASPIDFITGYDK